MVSPLSFQQGPSLRRKLQIVTMPTWAGRGSKQEHLKAASQLLNLQKYFLQLPYFRHPLWSEQFCSWSKDAVWLMTGLSEFLGEVEKLSSREKLLLYDTGRHISQHPCSLLLHPACWGSVRGEGAGSRPSLHPSPSCDWSRLHPHLIPVGHLPKAGMEPAHLQVLAEEGVHL